MISLETVFLLEMISLECIKKEPFGAGFENWQARTVMHDSNKCLKIVRRWTG